MLLPLAVLTTMNEKIKMFIKSNNNFFFERCYYSVVILHIGITSISVVLYNNHSYSKGE